jgi:hypothetical protein
MVNSNLFIGILGVRTPFHRLPNLFRMSFGILRSAVDAILASLSRNMARAKDPTPMAKWPKSPIFHFSFGYRGLNLLDGMT